MNNISKEQSAEVYRFYVNNTQFKLYAYIDMCRQVKTKSLPYVNVGITQKSPQER